MSRSLDLDSLLLVISGGHLRNPHSRGLGVLMCFLGLHAALRCQDSGDQEGITVKRSGAA